MDSAAGSVQSSSGGGGDDVSDSPVGFDAGELLANYGAPKFYPNSFASNPPLGHDGAWLHGATQPSRPSDPIQPPPPPLLPPPSVGKARLEQQPGSTRPKKRPRASRRAPTTVLTTDTSNFRQMVQKFTGVSTQSFSALARPCVDCFDSGAATARPAAAPEPKFLLRPFPQKVPITASFGPLPLPLGSISASRLPSTDSLPHPLPALDSLPLPVVGPTVSPSAPADGPPDTPATVGLSSLFAATSAGSGGLQFTWPDDRPPQLPAESGGGGGGSSRGGGSVDSWLCPSD